MNNQIIWDKHYEREKSKLSIPDENVVRSVLRYLKKKPEAIFLDAGCGTGRHVDFILKHTSNIFGMDFAANSLHSIKHNKLIQADVTNIPFSENSFDYVLAWGIIHYLPKENIETAMRELYRILKPGGILFFTLRSDNDTHLKKVARDGDLQGAEYLTFTRDESIDLCKNFKHTAYGYIERIIPEDISTASYPNDLKRVAHHMLECSK